MCDFLHLNVKHSFALENDLQSTNKCSVAQLCPILCGLMDQAPLSLRCSKQGYWRALPCPPPGHLTDPGIESGSLMSFAGGFFFLPLVPTRNPNIFLWKWKVKVMSLSHVQLFAIPWTVAHKAPQSMEFSKQEYYSGCHFLLQGIFLIQVSNPGLQHWRQMLLPFEPPGKPNILL